LSAFKKKDRRRHAGLAKKAGGARISAGIMAITDGYAIVPECLAWARCTRLKNEKKVTEKERAARLERILLKDKVDLVLGKGPSPAAVKWNNTYLKVMIQWFKRYGDKAMLKNKESLLLRFWETHTCVVGDTSTYPHEEVDASVALVASTVATFTPSVTCTTAVSAVGHTSAHSFPTRTAPPVPLPFPPAPPLPLPPVTLLPPKMTSSYLLLLLLGIQLHHMLLLSIP
jgi:hypothetical protein